MREEKPFESFCKVLRSVLQELKAGTRFDEEHHVDKETDVLPTLHMPVGMQRTKESQFDSASGQLLK